MSEPGTVFLDYETRSRADLKKVGAYRYGIDPSTEILMCAVSEASLDAPSFLWINPKFTTADVLGENEEAEELLAKAKLYTAHNCPFEIAVTWGAFQNGKPCPFKREPDLSQWRDTAAVARKAALPWALDKLGEALNLDTKKDTRGKALIKFFCEPRKDGQFNEPKDFPEKWIAFCEYCRTDVKAEKQAHHRLSAFELKGAVLESFQFDLRMNQRGIPVNVTALRNAQKIIDTVEERVTREFVELTGVQPTQRERVRQFIEGTGLVFPNMQAESVQAALDGVSCNPNGIARRTLELYQKLSYAAIKKVQTMQDWACPDQRMRGVFLWHGASTGRWTSKGPQLQNAKKPTQDMVKITESAFDSILKGADADEIECIFGEPYEVIASCIRHFVHDPTSEMLDADYNAIEARVACWDAGQHDILEEWRKGTDLYLRAVAFVFGVPEHTLTKKDPRRAFGKIVELACQFGQGEDGFMRACASWGVPCDEALATRAIRGYYRPTHKMICQRWWNFNDWMRNAIREPGVAFEPFVVRTVAGIKYLFQKLPSGRALAYPHIEMNRRDPTEKERDEMRNGKNYPDSRFLEITYWGQVPNSVHWGRVKLHGSLGFQHRVQGIAADLISHGALNADRAGMPPFMLVHDQGLALRQSGKSAADFSRALAQLPLWAKGIPLVAEAAEVRFYTK